MYLSLLCLLKVVWTGLPPRMTCHLLQKGRLHRYRYSDENTHNGSFTKIAYLGMQVLCLKNFDLLLILYSYVVSVCDFITSNGRLSTHTTSSIDE